MAQLRSQRDAPETQREYETIYVLRADASTDAIQDVNTRIRKVIEDGRGKVLRVDNWGKRKLAYEIKKQLKGIYLYWLYLGEIALVAEVERNLRMLDLVIRFGTVKVDENVHPEARPSEMDEESFLAAATTVPDEEDTYMGRGFADESEEGEGSAQSDEEDRDREPPAHDEEAKPAGERAETKDDAGVDQGQEN
jgi:small subunit ribosomal protein S6